MFPTYLILTAVILAWGLSFPIVKYVVGIVPVEWLIFVRFAAAGLFMSLLVFAKKHRRLTKGERIELTILTLLYPFGYFLFEAHGIKNTLPSNAATIIVLIPVLVLMLGYFFKMESLNPGKLLGVVLSAIGVYLLVKTDSGNRIHLTGDLLVLGAVLLAAISTLLTKRLLKTVSALYITAYEFTVASLLILPIALTKDTAWVSNIDTRTIIAILFLSGVCSGFAPWGMNYALSKLSMTQASVACNLIPVITLAAQGFIVDLSATRYQMIIMAIVIGSVLIVQMAGRERPTPARKPEMLVIDQTKLYQSSQVPSRPLP